MEDLKFEIRTSARVGMGHERRTPCYCVSLFCWVLEREVIEYGGHDGVSAEI